jgi:hypothetical protein
MPNRYHAHIDGDTVAIFRDLGKGYRNPLIATYSDANPADSLYRWVFDAGYDAEEREARCAAAAAAIATWNRAADRVQA